jgi:hypothetical protein
MIAHGRDPPAPPSSPTTSRPHIIRRVSLRQIAIMNYIIPF